jgi:hypothetical protein
MSQSKTYPLLARFARRAADSGATRALFWEGVNMAWIRADAFLK